MESGAPFFKDILARLEHRMRRREFSPRAIIVGEGSAEDAAFLILAGRVAVRRKDPDSGIEFLLAELGEGEMFGEMALLTRKPRTASVVALEPARRGHRCIAGVDAAPAAGRACGPCRNLREEVTSVVSVDI